MPCNPPDTIQFAISSAQFARGCNAIYSNMKFFVATIDRSHISYISTRDSLFRTPEGIHIGSNLKDVMQAGGNDIIEETGWAYYSRLPSGWRVKYSGILKTDKFNAVYEIYQTRY
jgi:hypothetical protein